MLNQNNDRLEKIANKLNKASNIMLFVLCIILIVIVIAFIIFSIYIYLSIDIADENQYEKYLIKLMRRIFTDIFKYDRPTKKFNYLSFGFIILYIVIFAIIVAILLNIGQIILNEMVHFYEEQKLSNLNSLIDQLLVNSNLIDQITNENLALQSQNNNNMQILQQKQLVMNSVLIGSNINGQTYNLNTNELMEIIEYISNLFDTDNVLNIIQQNQQNQTILNNILYQGQICSNVSSTQLINALAPTLTGLFNGNIPNSSQLVSKINTLNSYKINGNIANDMLAKCQLINSNVSTMQDINNFLNYIAQQTLPGQLPNESVFAYLDRMFDSISQAQQASLQNQMSMQSLRNKNILLKQLTNQYISFFADNFQYVASLGEMTNIINNIFTQMTNVFSILNYSSPSSSSAFIDYIQSIQKNPDIVSLMNSYAAISDKILPITSTSSYDQYFTNLSQLVNILTIQSKNSVIFDNSLSQKRLSNLLKASILGAQEDLNYSLSNTINSALHNISAFIQKNTPINESLQFLQNNIEVIQYAKNNNIFLSDQIEQENSNLSFIIEVNNKLASIFTNLITVNSSVNFNYNLFSNNIFDNIEIIEQISSNPLPFFTNFYNQLNKISGNINKINSIDSSNFNPYSNNVFSAIDSVYNSAQSIVNNSNTYAQNISDLISLNQTINTEFTSSNPWSLNTRLQLNYEIDQYIKNIEMLENSNASFSNINGVYTTYDSIYKSLQPLGIQFHQLTENMQDNGSLYNNIDKLFTNYINSFSVINNNISLIENINAINDINEMFQLQYGGNAVNTNNFKDTNAISSSFDFMSLMNNIKLLSNNEIQYPILSYNSDQMSNLLSSTSGNIFDQWNNLTTLDKVLSLHNFLILPTNLNNDSYNIVQNGNNIAEHYTSGNSSIANGILYNLYLVLNNINASKINLYSVNNLGTILYTNWQNSSIQDLNLFLNNSYNLLFQYAKWKFYAERLLQSKIVDLLANGYYDFNLMNLNDISQYLNESSTLYLNTSMTEEYIEQINNPNLVVDITIT